MANKYKPRSDAEAIAVVAKAVSDLGGPAGHWPILARGFIATLHETVWERYDATVGTAEELEKLCRWPGKPRLLASALIKAGYLSDHGGVLVAIRALQLMPDAVAKRWRRRAAEAYRDAKALAAAKERTPKRVHERHKQVDDMYLLPEVAEDGSFESMELDLFGNPVSPEPMEGKAKNGRSKPTGQPGHKQFVEWWTKRFNEEHGFKYPWRERDFDHVTELLKVATEYATLCEWAERYLRCREHFYTGHPLAKLLSAITRFASGGPARSEYGSQAGASIPFDASRVRRSRFGRADTRSEGDVGEVQG